MSRSTVSGALTDGQIAPRPSGGGQKRSAHAFVVQGLLPFVWPKDRPDLRLRVVLAAIVLVIAKNRNGSCPGVLQACNRRFDEQRHRRRRTDISKHRHRCGGHDYRLWRGSHRDGCSDANPRCSLHVRRPARRAVSEQAHLPPPASALASLSPGATDRRTIACHRASNASD